MTSFPRSVVLALALACTASVATAQQDAAAPAKAEAAGAIPPSDKTAVEALTNSPRHGEWVDIALPGSEMKIKAFVAFPERSDKAPVVLVIHEIFGLTDWVRGVADQLAADGFIAIAPDLLSGMGPDGGGTEALGEKARETIRSLTPDQVAARLNAVRDYALNLPSASGKTASIGFCWGGTASFNYAVRQPGLNAAVVYYGTGPMKDNQPDVEAMSKIAAPVLGCYGGDDARVTSTVVPTAKAMAEAKKPFTHHAYDKAGHGFLRQSTADQRDGANLKAAQEAWKTTIEFLREHTK
jgi:carboxymethylenebutenolidase